MDIQLPEMSGIEVIRLLKQDDELRSIPIIAVTAFAMPSEEEAIRAAGSDDYISKPIDILRFLKAVDRLLPRPSDSLVAHESE
jgi:two-component system cell cycle response regulator DivK